MPSRAFRLLLPVPLRASTARRSADAIASTPAADCCASRVDADRVRRSRGVMPSCRLSTSGSSERRLRAACRAHIELELQPLADRTRDLGYGARVRLQWPALLRGRLIRHRAEQVAQLGSSARQRLLRPRARAMRGVQLLIEMRLHLLWRAASRGPARTRPFRLRLRSATVVQKLAGPRRDAGRSAPRLYEGRALIPNISRRAPGRLATVRSISPRRRDNSDRGRCPGAAPEDGHPSRGHPRLVTRQTVP